MTKDEIREVLKSCVRPETSAFEHPTIEEWDSIESRFSCKFPPEMRDFIDLMAEFAFPGDILNVGAGYNNGNDTIELAYNEELKGNSSWSSEMIPFYSIGNGDYFCISSLDGIRSAVYCYYHDRRQFEKYSNSFESWILHLPVFLAK